ncbi:Ni/Fe hydrogenase subunit alpha [Candidatus Viridilinea mediisalina]|uniref:Ni/Fe hydrogenase subunit alpha n=1 Tax=Candidatus Viridilinea mediisalina TaxID=2024553 RepID=A0A2A6RNN8_9CHLR|nr:Ni/Fe hydrogenase subunit alpha [Candidatus Viridilinea mediisalina]PDW04498.1 Ni/Fe hydrogenase subunit alpha [Candidatus Viridilinea mediisalina]
MQRITIDPVTRLEGHGRIEIFLNDEGDVANAYFIVPELRGFEQFCVGRPAEEMPRITSRICGVCPEAHHMAATKTLDALFNVEPPAAAKKLRELFYSSFYVTDHTTHFYALAGPDFVLGPDAPPAERNILGVVRKVGLEIGRAVIDARIRNHEIIKLIGGRGVHPVAGLPGGWSKPLAPEDRAHVEEVARKNVEFALFSLKLFEDVVLGNPAYRELILADTFTHNTYSMGTVDANNYVNFYDGMIRVVDPEGNEFVKYHPRDYAKHIAERSEPWTYLKFPYLKGVGWNGFVDGKQSGVYVATPLSRLNAADGMATPRAQEFFEQFYTTLSTKGANGRYKPVHYRLATHWARLIELLYAAERMLELATDPEITSPHVRTPVSNLPREGAASVEAPRGTLTHHYWTDENGILTRVNLIVGTTNNYAPIAMSVKKAAQSLISKGTVVTEGLLNRIEMGFRAYDPCFGCATHALPGQMPLEVVIRDAAGEELQTLSQYC